MNGCGCACSSGGFCGGCGHAGCGGRGRAAGQYREQRDRYGFAWTPVAMARANSRAPWAKSEDED